MTHIGMRHSGWLAAADGRAFLWSARLVCALFCALLLATPPALAGDIVDKEIALSDKNTTVSVHYPVLGIDTIDADLLEWAQQTAEAFMSEVAEMEHEHPYELKATYRIVRSPKTVSVVWNVWNFTGGAHGNLDIVTFVYDTGTKQPVELHDLFSDEQSVLNLLSNLSHTKLAETLGTMADAEMIKSGTSPDLDNFACVVPTPEGVRVYFQPYQVAPWAAGPQEVNIALQELQDAGPKKIYWEQ